MNTIIALCMMIIALCMVVITVYGLATITASHNVACWEDDTVSYQTTVQRPAHAPHDAKRKISGYAR